MIEKKEPKGMYLKLDHPPISLDAYRPYMDPELADELTSVAAGLRDLAQ